MVITVTICTWNRAKLLDHTLAEMHKLHIPDGVEWELLVVNNNCSDETDEVIARHSGQLPIRCLFESKQGLSNSRNCAIAASKGELLLWTDDDVLVDPQWLAAYVNAAERWPKAVYFGALIVPWYEQRPPSYIEANLKSFEGMLVIRNFGPTERPFKNGELPFGANMAFRRCVFEKWGYNPRLGRRATDPILGEESELFRTLRKKGLEGVWVPTAKVRHYVPRERITSNYIWDYGTGYGRTLTRTKGTPEGRILFGAPRWLYRTYWDLRYKSFLQRLMHRPWWAVTYFQAAVINGKISECRAQFKAASLRSIGESKTEIP